MFSINPLERLNGIFRRILIFFCKCNLQFFAKLFSALWDKTRKKSFLLLRNLKGCVRLLIKRIWRKCYCQKISKKKEKFPHCGDYSAVYPTAWKIILRSIPQHGDYSAVYSTTWKIILRFIPQHGRLFCGVSHNMCEMIGQKIHWNGDILKHT